ncbi:hypothetical protein B0H11DRAFT_197595 [Mycena galericulata]|nr:hypothetical protein B0H11DRAFT_197595 [Mycena galericulata]
MLQSLISYRPNRKKISSKSPFPFRKPDPTSPHPYATQVFDIGDSSFDDQEPDARPSYEPSPQLPPPGEPAYSPRVDVNIDFTPADWFPSHFLKSDSIAGPSGLTSAANAIVTGANAGKSAETLHTTDDGEEEDDDLSATSEDVVSNLEALGASDFVNLPESDGLMGAQSTQFPSVMAARKGAPSPIKIPNASLHGPKVQIVRSAASQSRPESMFSLDGASAISGTTLARALIGDSYVLSSDRSSRYRSGASVLTRSDSATLPRGDNPFSPAWSGRKSGAYTPVDSMGFPIPPVPQMPEELRRVIAENRDRLKADESAAKKSRPQSVSDAEAPVSPHQRTLSEDARVSHRVSLIPEAPTPTSSAPFTPDAGPSTPDAPSVSDSAPRSDTSPNTSNFHHGASPSTFPTSPGQSSTSASEARDSRDIDNVLDYYNFEPSPGFQEGASSSFDPPTPDIVVDQSRFHPAFSPITEESGSQLSPDSFRSRRTVNGKISLSSSPSPSSGSGRLEWRPSEIRSLPPHPLLPIGDRPRSTPVRSIVSGAHSH